MFENKSNEELFKMAHSGNKDARDYLIEKNLRLVYKIAHEYNFITKLDFETLSQEGTIGLIKAVDRFEVERGLQFSTYASWLIRGQMNTHLRDLREDKPFRIKRADKSLYNKSLRARDELQQKLLREPTLKEVSKNLGVEIIELERVLNCIEGHKSIYDIYHEGKDGVDIMQIDVIENQNNISEEQIIEGITFNEKLNQLTELQRKVIQLRYFNDLTQLQAGEILNTNQVQISRIEKRALNMLREII